MEKQSPVQEKNQQLRKIADTEARWKNVFNRLGGFDLGNSFNQGFGSAFGANPFISNQRLNMLSTTPVNVNREVLENALKDPANSELTLRAATHDIINNTYPLYRLQYLYEGILSYHNYSYPLYVDKSKMSKPDFKSDMKFIDMWTKALAPKKSFRRIVAEIMAEGKKAYVIRQNFSSETGKENVDYVMLQNLPSDYYKIVNITSDSYFEVSFNFFYFMNPGTSLDHFPPIFRKIYQDVLGDVSVNDRGQIIDVDISKASKKNGVSVEYNYETNTWAYWATLPSDLAWVFSFTEADMIVASPLISLLLLGSDLNNYNLLQQQLVSAPLNSIILGELSMDSQTKNSGYAIDSFNLSPEAMNMFEQGINGVLHNANIAYKMTPSTKNQMFNIPTVPNSQAIYNEAVKGLINTAGSGALQTMSERPTVAQSNNAKITEFRFIDRIYAQFEHFVNTMFKNMYLEKHLKYNWAFKIFGNAYTDDEKFVEIQGALVLGQKQFALEYNAMMDKSLLDVKSQIDFIDSTGIYKKFEPLQSGFQTSNKSGSDDKGGRPAEKNTDNENTAASQNQGAVSAREG